MIRNERIQETLHKMAEFGVDHEGGTTRLSYSKEFFAAQEHLRQEMLKLGNGGCCRAYRQSCWHL